MQQANYILLVGALCLITACSGLTNGRGESEIATTPTMSDVVTPTAHTTASDDRPSPTSQNDGATERKTSLSYDTLEEFALETAAYEPTDMDACNVPELPTPDDRAETVQVFYECVPEGQPALPAVPARNIVVPSGHNPKYVAIEELLAGPTEEEQQEGYISVFGKDSQQVDFDIEVFDTGLAVINFDPSILDIPLMFVASSSGHQIVTTLGQFSDIDRVTILIDGELLSCAVGEC